MSCRRWSALLTLSAVLALVAPAAPRVLAQSETPTPQLPVLLLDGAIYTQEYDAGTLPASFRLDGYDSRVTALYMVQCEGPIKEVWVEDMRSIGGSRGDICL